MDNPVDNNTPEPMATGAEPAAELVLTQRDSGSIRIENATPPEYIDVSRELWDQLYIDPTEADEAGPMWLETIGHADPEIPNDGYMLHVDAENVTCSYRTGARLPEEGNVRATLASWGEK